jgi:outer membrane protein assembly factor BamB
MSVDTATSDVKELVHFDGYPCGLTYSEKDGSLIVCDNESPSYFVYEGGNYARLVKINLTSQERTLIPCENCHDYISNVAIGKNGSLWTADYINDTVFLMTSDGHVTFSFNGPSDETVLNPLDIATDKEGRVFVLCTSSKCVYVLDETGRYETSLGLDYMPCSVEAHAGRLWVGEMDDNKVHVYTYSVH